MRLASVASDVVQLSFDFIGDGPQAPLPLPPADQAMMDEDETEAGEADVSTGPDEAEEDFLCGPAPDLEGQCRQLLLNLGIETAKDLVQVHWNPRLRSTAGYARYPSWRIELNPRLIAFEGQVDRTLRHELAHLVAYHRAGRRRIDPHGREWQQACSDLGIPDEPARHHLPLPRSQQHRPHAYQCPVCRVVVNRVRPFKRATACLACCRKYSGGQFDERFKFVKQQPVHPQPALRHPDP